MSNTEQENSFGGTEGSLFGVEEGQLVGGVTLGGEARAAGSPHSESSVQHAGSVPCRAQHAGGPYVDCHYPTIRRTFLLSRP